MFFLIIHYRYSNVFFKQKTERISVRDEINIHPKTQFVKPKHNKKSRFFAKKFFSPLNRLFFRGNRSRDDPGPGNTAMIIAYSIPSPVKSFWRARKRIVFEVIRKKTGEKCENLVETNLTSSKNVV